VSPGKLQALRDDGIRVLIAEYLCANDDCPTNLMLPGAKTRKRTALRD
jgi:hypothetical protein